MARELPSIIQLPALPILQPVYSPNPDVYGVPAPNVHPVALLQSSLKKVVVCARNVVFMNRQAINRSLTPTIACLLFELMVFLFIYYNFFSKVSTCPDFHRDGTPYSFSVCTSKAYDYFISKNLSRDLLLLILISLH
jgi:hypothetical protein